MTSEPAADDAGTDTQAQSPVESQHTVEDTKRKMREALEAKKGRRGEDHIDNDPRAPQAHGPVDSKRTFRRKTG